MFAQEVQLRIVSTSIAVFVNSCITSDSDFDFRSRVLDLINHYGSSNPLRESSNDRLRELIYFPPETVLQKVP